MHLPKVIVIGGPTATGKTDIAIELALLFNGEIVNADSRQVYRGLDIGSAKVRTQEMKGVPHHLLDVADPATEQFSVAEYQKQAQHVLAEIVSRNTIPIICGGTGFYIDTVIYHQQFPEIAPNPKLRDELDGYTSEELFAILTKKDSRRARQIDPHNKVRLIRALEIIEVLGSVPESSRHTPYDVLYLCLELDKETHYQYIEERIHTRMEQGMLEEVINLHKQGVSYETLERFGLEYRYLAYVLQNKMSKEDALRELAMKTKSFVKRQYTWFKKHEDIIWFDPRHEKDALITTVRSFLDNQ